MQRTALLLAALLLTPLATLQAADKPAKLNVLFFFADDQRADTIAALGNPIIKTPNLDRLARRGMSFQRAHMQGAHNGATCVPSRAMLLSGENLFHIDEKLLRDETWPEAFGRAGYTTFISGKWHNGDASLVRGFQIARSMFTGGMMNPMQAKLREVANGKVGPARDEPKHACEVFANEAIRFLKEHAGGPFFAYVPFDAPHDPHIVPADFPINYDPAQIPLPPSFLPLHPWENGELTGRDERLLPWPRTSQDVRAMLAEYYRYISYLDAQIGRVLDALEASPYAKNTIVVFAADSGVARGSHGLVGKQNLYEFDSVRVPLIIDGPGIPADSRSEALCYLFDVLPTLGKLCGVHGPKTSEGIEFTATLADPAKPARGQLVFAYKSFQRAICDARWKLIRYPQVDRTQLFDLQNDPHEAVNLADKPEQAAKVAELMTRMEKELKSSGDTLPLTVANPKPADWTPPAKQASQAPQPAVEPDARLHADGKGWRLDKAKITDPSRPRVLLIGDSILNGYQKQVVRALDGKAFVDAWVNPYCQSEHLNKLLAEILDQGPYDVVHFNMGLHGWQEGRIKPGTFEPLTKAYVQVIKDKLPKARIIWASITPVTTKGKPAELNAEINPVVVEQNRMAAKVMTEMQVPTNDFYGLLVDKLDLARGDQFHWTAPAYEMLAKAVVDSVSRELAAAKPSDAK